VPYPPAAAQLEFIPAQPASDTVWVDGEWRWSETRYRWHRGGWTRPPAGAKLALSVLVRAPDGRLFFAPTTWLDAQGHAVAEPTPVVEAETRLSNVSAPP
jgi:hypothetical protein